MEYCTTSEVAARLRWSRRTVREKIRNGVFRLNEHFFQPPGCQMRWKWSAVAAWLEGERTGISSSGDLWFVSSEIPEESRNRWHSPAGCR